MVWQAAQVCLKVSSPLDWEKTFRFDTGRRRVVTIKM
jgi:hypothetical protein